jgi:hypothetical protein
MTIPAKQFGTIRISISFTKDGALWYDLDGFRRNRFFEDGFEKR